MFKNCEFFVNVTRYAAIIDMFLITLDQADPAPGQDHAQNHDQDHPYEEVQLLQKAFCKCFV